VNVIKRNLSVKHSKVEAVPSLSHVSYFLLYNIKLIAIRLSYSVNFKLVHSHPTVTENPEMLSTFRLRKEFKTLHMSTRKLQQRMKSIIQSLGGIHVYDSYEEAYSQFSIAPLNIKFHLGHYVT